MRSVEFAVYLLMLQIYFFFLNFEIIKLQKVLRISYLVLKKFILAYCSVPERTWLGRRTFCLIPGLSLGNPGHLVTLIGKNKCILFLILILCFVLGTCINS